MKTIPTLMLSIFLTLSPLSLLAANSEAKEPTTKVGFFSRFGFGKEITLNNALRDLTSKPLRTIKIDMSFFWKTLIGVFALGSGLADLLEKTSHALEGHSWKEKTTSEKFTEAFLAKKKWKKVYKKGISFTTPIMATEALYTTMNPLLSAYLVWHFFGPLREFVGQYFRSNISLHKLIASVQEEERFLSPKEGIMLSLWYEGLKNTLASFGIKLTNKGKLSDKSTKKLSTFSSDLADLLSRAEKARISYQKKKSQESYGSFITATFDLAQEIDKNVSTEADDADEDDD